MIRLDSILSRQNTEVSVSLVPHVAAPRMSPDRLCEMHPKGFSLKSARSDRGLQAMGRATHCNQGLFSLCPTVVSPPPHFGQRCFDMSLRRVPNYLVNLLATLRRTAFTNMPLRRAWRIFRFCPSIVNNITLLPHAYSRTTASHRPVCAHRRAEPGIMPYNGGKAAQTRQGPLPGPFN